MPAVLISTQGNLNKSLAYYVIQQIYLIDKEVLQTLRQQVNQPRALLEMTHDFRYFITGACFRIPFEDQQNPRTVPCCCFTYDHNNIYGFLMELKDWILQLTFLSLWHMNI